MAISQTTPVVQVTAPTSGVIPSQTGQAGKYLSTDGTAASWSTVDALPAQTGKAGKYLQTNGTTASWEALNVGEPPAWWAQIAPVNSTWADPTDIAYDKATGRVFVLCDVRNASDNERVTVTAVNPDGSTAWHREITYGTTLHEAQAIAHVRGHVYVGWFDADTVVYFVTLLDDSTGAVVGSFEVGDVIEDFAAVQDHALVLAGTGPVISALLHPEPYVTFPLDITATGGSNDGGDVLVNDGGFYTVIRTTTPTSTSLYRMRSIGNDALDADNWTLVFTIDEFAEITAGGDGNFYASNAARVVCYSKTGTLLWARASDPAYTISTRIVVPSPDGICVIDRVTTGADACYVTRLTGDGNPLRQYAMKGFRTTALATGMDFRVAGGVCLDDSVILIGRGVDFAGTRRAIVAHVPFKPRIDIQAVLITDEYVLEWYDHSLTFGFDPWVAGTDPTSASGVTVGIADAVAPIVTSGVTVTVSTGAVEAAITNGSWVNTP